MLHVDDMFDEMFVMASRGLVKVLFKLLLWYHCFPIILLILIYHSNMGCDLDSRLEKVA